jgi:ABC-type transport system substrate-binding protein
MALARRALGQRSRLITLSAGLLVALVVGAGTLASRSAAAPESERHGAAAIPLLRVGIAASIPTLDAARTTLAGYATSLALETLMKLGPDGKPVPNLAQSVSQPRPAVYVYQLRRGIKFWDGKELTAADVANSMNYNRYPGSKVAGLAYGSVKNVVAKGRYTVVVTLRHPDASWQNTATQWETEVFEEQFANAHAGSYGQPGVLTMGTGPWRITSLDPSRGVELVANPRYWGGKISIQRISIKFFADETSMALAFRQGEIDAVPQIFDPRAWASTAGSKPASVPSCAASMVSMDTAGPPWNDVHLRRAVAYALNRKDFVSAVGYATPNATLITPSQLRTIASQSEVDALLKSLPSYNFSIAKARAELAKSAYPRGLSAPLNVPSFGAYPTAGQVMQSALSKIGINLDLKVVPVGTWIAQVVGPVDKKGINFVHADCASEDPSFYYELLGSKNLKAFNIASYAPSAVETLLTAGIATADPAKRFDVYSKLLKRLGADVPYAPLYVENANYAISKRFSWNRGSNWYSAVGPWALTIKQR